MIRRALPILTALAMLHEFGTSNPIAPAPFLRELDPEPLTEQDVERIEAAKAKRARRASKRAGVL